jgi:hypothetical protein
MISVAASQISVAAVNNEDLKSRQSWTYAVTIFLSAFLLFQVQLILGKYFLPWFGGTPAMWTTCMFFFQTLLVVGYLYTHALANHVIFQWQGRIHAIVLTCALTASLVIALKWHSPLLPEAKWKPVGPGDPVLSLVILLLMSAGAPYLALSATGPLLQSWFGQAYPELTPYRLYSLSNLGSFLGLLSYPFAVEPWLTLKIQAYAWFGGFVVFVFLCGYCALKLSQQSSLSTTNCLASIDQRTPGPRPSFMDCIFWLLLAACGSLLFLATTNQICQTIAVVPLLWVLPLGLYLLSLVTCFDAPKYYRRALFHLGFAAALAMAMFLLSGGELTHLRVQIVCYALILFVGCMVCHGELVRAKPAAQHLTLFYLMVSSGGALAGVFVVLIAPRVFNAFWEYQLALWLTTVLLLVSVIRDKSSWVYENRFGVALIALGAAVLPGFFTAILHGRVGVDYLFFLVILCFALYFVSRRAISGFAKVKWQAAVLFSAFGVLLLSVIFLLSTKLENQGALFTARNFYGVLTVTEINPGSDGEAYRLSHGRVSHGFQFRSPAMSHIATSYYGEESGVGKAIAEIRQRGNWQYTHKLRLGVIGLGVGTLASYAQAGDSVRFYEINPDVIRLANDQNYFTYLKDCPANVAIVSGDARLSMERELAEGTAQNFDLLVVDAFSGDAPPVHLFTLQAFAIYLKELSDSGILAMHVTNTYLDLRPVIASIAAAAHLNRVFLHNDGNGRATVYSDWVLLSRAPLSFKDSLDPKYDRKSVLWTDDYSNLFQVLR